MNLQEGLTLPIGWVNQSNKCTLVVCKLDNVSSPVVVQSLTVLPYHSWKVPVYGKCIKNCSALVDNFFCMVTCEL